MVIMRLIYLTIFLLLLSATAQGRMYQWKDPDTGTTQLSGKPPAWYRSGESGPRVFVFDKGRIIDDTSIELSDVQRDSLRQEALLQTEKDRQKAIEEAKEAEEMKAQINMGTKEEVPFMNKEEEPEVIPDKQAESVEDENKQEKLTEERMRALITEWENQKTEQARKKADTVLQDSSPD